MGAIIWFLFGFTASLTLAFITAMLLKRRGKSEPQIRIFSSLEDMKAIGELHAFKVVTKEIVTEKDHIFGQSGTKYFEWLLSSKKMAMIFEFDISFSYNLKDGDFEIVEVGPDSYNFKMPACRYDIHIKDIEFYDEQRAKLLPLLLPELISNIFSSGFGEQERNTLKDAAKEQAEVLAKEMVGRLMTDVRASAEVTLRSIAKSFGAKTASFEYKEDSKSLSIGEVKLDDDAIRAA